jgi:hypothetical protein
VPWVAGEDFQALPTLSGWMLLKLALQLNQPTIAKLQILISCAKKKCIHYFHMFSLRPRLDVIFPGDSCQMRDFQVLVSRFWMLLGIPFTSIWKQ